MCCRNAHSFAHGADISARHYPERLGLFLVVGAPRIFGGLWRMLQPLVDPVTRAKIKFLPCAPARLLCCASSCLAPLYWLSECTVV